MRGRKRGGKGGVRPALLIALLASLLAVPVTSGAPSSGNQARLDSTVRFLQGAQNADGGFGGSPGAKSGQLFTAWVALALAAAGINPQDQALPGGTDAYSYLVSHREQGIAESDCAPIACTTTFERELMVVNASGTSPRDFGGVDLVEELLDRARSDGAFPHVPGGQPGVNDTIFAIFSLAPIDEPAAQAPIQRAADWVESAQQEVGGWAWRAGNAPHEVDMTGAAIQALVTAGRSGNPSVQRGLTYLRESQNPDGGFPEFPGEPESNAASTCWAAQAIWAAGENPETWHTDSGQATEEPLDYLESLQASDGHIRWKTSDDLNGVWMTAYCAPAFAGQAWPIPAAPRSNDPVQPPDPGQGEGTQAGNGVIAGGGGKGAPLFSRPKPQSKGKTPGGTRVVKSGGVKAKNHSRTRRGGNAEQSTGTQTSEAARAAIDAEQSEATASGQGAGAGGPLPRALAAASGGSAGSGAGQEVTGTLIGSPDQPQSDLHFGAPGLHGAGVEGGNQEAVAIVIGGAALLLVLGGVGWERRRQEAIL
jgi:prenyltransferase beta subunit